MPGSTKPQVRALVLVDETEAAFRRKELEADASLRRFKDLCVAIFGLVFSVALALALAILLVRPRDPGDRLWAGTMLAGCAFTGWSTARLLWRGEWRASTRKRAWRTPMPGSSKLPVRAPVLVDEKEAAFRRKELAADAALRRFKDLTIAIIGLVFSAVLALTSAILLVRPCDPGDRLWAGTMLVGCAFTGWSTTRFLWRGEWGASTRRTTVR